MAKDLQTYLSNRRTRLPRQIAVEAAAQALVASHNEHGGATFSLYFGNVAGQNLYAVSLFLERTSIVPGKMVSARQMHKFITDNIDLLADPRLCIGTWYDEEEDTTYLDIVATLPDKPLVLRLASQYNQIAVYDLANKEVAFIGGTGKPVSISTPEFQRLPPLIRQRGNAND